jgi:hypothetical protein
MVVGHDLQRANGLIDLAFLAKPLHPVIGHHDHGGAT